MWKDGGLENGGWEVEGGRYGGWEVEVGDVEGGNRLVVGNRMGGEH